MTSTGHTGHIEMQIWAIYSMIGSIVHMLRLHISTAHWDGTQAIGDLAFTPATHAATTTTLDDQPSITFTMALIVGEWMAEEVGTMVENSSTEESITTDMAWEIVTYVATITGEEAIITIMVQSTKTTTIAALAINSAETSMDHVLTNTTHHERVLLEQQLHNQIMGIALVVVEATEVQQEAMSQVPHSAHQAIALVVAQHLEVVAQAAVTTQMVVAPSVDIDNDIDAIKTLI